MKPKNNFSHTYFGILKDVSTRGNMLVITSEDGQERMMSKRKYKAMADNVEAIARNLIGKEVNIRTSQNTGPWPDTKWFSGIELFA